MCKSESLYRVQPIFEQSKYRTIYDLLDLMATVMASSRRNDTGRAPGALEETGTDV
jgi:hypothetical protein